MVTRCLAFVLFAACHNTAPAPPGGSNVRAETHVPTSATTGASDGASEGPSYGETCGANDACAPGLTCEKYQGVAGARGPQFKTCELRCGATTQCPDGKHCNTIADGPGRVCR